MSYQDQKLKETLIDAISTAMSLKQATAARNLLDALNKVTPHGLLPLVNEKKIKDQKELTAMRMLHGTAVSHLKAALLEAFNLARCNHPEVVEQIVTAQRSIDKTNTNNL